MNLENAKEKFNDRRKSSSIELIQIADKVAQQKFATKDHRMSSALEIKYELLSMIASFRP